MDQNKKSSWRDRIFVGLFAILLGGFGIGNILKADETYSMSERRTLAQFPAFSLESLSSGTFMTAFEKYTQDQFLGRETFRSAKAAAELYGFAKKDNNGIYMKDGYVSTMEYPLKEESIHYAAEKFRQIAEQYLTTENHAYLSFVPDKNFFMAEDNGYLSMDYGQFFTEMKNEASFLTYIDISGLLELEDYYKTDTHWRQEKITDVARYLAAEMSGEKTDSKISAEQYEQVQAKDDFYGVYTGQLALPVEPEPLIYLDNSLLQNCEVYDYQNQKETKIYDLERAEGKDPYQLFLSGDISLLTIHNPEGQTGKELIIFRDSFGSSLAPLLMEYYDKITLVDIRYLPSSRLGKYIEFTDQDVLFLYSTLVLNNSDTLR